MSLIETPETLAADAALPSTLRLGAVHLTVADLGRAVTWYQRALGLRVHRHDITTAELGDGIESVVVLHEDSAARPAGRHAGLYHYALLFPSREELGRVAVRLAATGTPIQGASDHGTHEAIYLPDADGNGIELAWDRPRDQWPAGLGYDRGPAPLDFESLLNSVAGEQPADVVAEGLRMGHLHLHVGDLEQALRFYRDLLGFDVQANIGSAAFLSAGAYHHHLGINVWNGQGVAGAPSHTAGLRRWTVQLPTGRDVEVVHDRLVASDHAVERTEDGFTLADPWGTTLAVVSTAASGLHDRAIVPTGRATAYLKQVAKHFRHKLDVEFDDHRAVVAFPFGHAELSAQDDQLRLDAFAHTPKDLARVEQIIGSHLERFGRRDELTVAWTATLAQERRFV